MSIVYGASWLLLTVVVFWLAKKLYGRWSIMVLLPILTAPIVLVVLLESFHVSYGTYLTGSKWLTYMLQPATVAFAVPMMRHFELLKKHALEIVSSVVLGSMVAIVTSMVLAGWLHLNATLADSLAPRSVTTPIAMVISQKFGGVSTMTAVFVMVTAMCGIVIGPLVIRYLSLRSAVARGVMFGMGAHGAGTSRAFEMGAVEGTVASLSMIIAAGASLLIAPLLVPLMQSTLF
ncbi:MAG: LrgB family protein [Tumebacillaceae bacterium]